MKLTNEEKHNLRKGQRYYEAVFFDGEGRTRNSLGYFTNFKEAKRAITDFISNEIDGGFLGLNALDQAYISQLEADPINDLVFTPNGVEKRTIWHGILRKTYIVSF